MEEVILAVMEQQELEKPESSKPKVPFKNARLSGYKNKNDGHCFLILWSLVKSKQSFGNLMDEVKYVYMVELQFENLIKPSLIVPLVSLVSQHFYKDKVFLK